MMDINRNQWFMAGMVLLLLGLQFRMIDSFNLTPELTQFLAERTNHPLAAVNASTAAITPDQKPIAKKKVNPPEWIGWMLLSVGATFILHSLAMKKP